MSKNFDKNEYALVVGGASMDLTFTQTNDGGYSSDPIVVSPGGKGANQAVAIARAGSPVKFLSLLGGGDIPGTSGITDDAATKLIIENLEKNGVDTSYIEVKDGVKNDMSSICVDKDGENHIFRQTGAIDNFYIGMIDKNAELIKNAKYVVAQMKAPLEFTKYLLTFCKENNVPVILTPCRPKKLADNLDLIDQITYITANEEECKTVFKTDDIEECVRQCKGKLIVTRGENGVVYYEDGQVKKIPAIKIKNVVDTTGAGDTLNGNLVSCLMEGMNLTEALIHGVVAATLKIQKETAQLGMPYKKEREALLTQIKAKR